MISSATLQAGAKAARFLREAETEQTPPRGAASDEELEDAGEHSLCRATERLGKSICRRIRTDRRREIERGKIHRSLSTVRA